MVFCSFCGSLIPPRESICPDCGRSIHGDDELTSAKNDQNDAAMVEKENPELPFFPYVPRPVQIDIVKDIENAVQYGKHIILESGTGTGKTIVSLAGTLAYAKMNGKKVIYLTRTISQSDQVMKELRAISRLRNVTGIAITGRGRSCPYAKKLPNGESIPAAVLASICEQKKKNVDTDPCEFHKKMLEQLNVVEGYARNRFPTSEDLDRFCTDRGICPYEAKKALMYRFDVIVAPYIHILSEDIRNGFLGNLQSDGENLILIIDEAHNMVDAAREQESYSIPMKLIEAAIDETTTFRKVKAFKDIDPREFIQELKYILKSFANDKLSFTVKEALLKNTDLEDRLMAKFKLVPAELERVVSSLIDIGNNRTVALMERGENRISDIYTLSMELHDWITAKDDKYIKMVRVSDEEESFHASCIDPYDVISFIRNTKGAVHMSGTLQPLDQYIKVMGLPQDSVQRIYPSPFPKENKSVIYLGNVTTRYEDMKKDPSIFSRMEKNIAKLCNGVEKNTLVFFPSYSLMERMKPYLERDVHKDLYWEVKGKPNTTMRNLYSFRRGRNGVFFTVMGGSIAEGIDFPGEELSFSIIVGIPYPPPTLETKAMSALFDERYGRGSGWLFTSEVPALRKMQQAIGRMIRTETDRGMAVIFDNRASKYESKLDAHLSTDPLGEVTEFFSKIN